MLLTKRSLRIRNKWLLKDQLFRIVAHRVDLYASHTAISLASSSSTRRQTDEPLFRRNSTQAELSTRITPSG